MRYIVQVFRPAGSEGPAKCWLYGDQDGQPMEHVEAEGHALCMRTERPELTLMVLPLRPAP